MSEPLVLRDRPVKSWLIQRLGRPVNYINPFSQGAGLSNLGFKRKTYQDLSSLFSFEYMGSAEFEWGAIPEAFKFISSQAEAKNLVTGEIRQVFYICPKSYKEAVEKTITELIENETNYRLQEPCYLSDSLKKKPSEGETVGWVELDNGFMFFVDSEMFNQVKKIFNI